MSVEFPWRKHTFWPLICLFTLAVTDIASSEVVSIDEFLSTAMPNKTVSEVFSCDLPGGFYAASYCPKYVSFTNARREIIDTPLGPKEANRPSEIYIFDANGRTAVMQNEAGNPGVRFLPEKGWFYLSGDARTLDIYDIGGRLIKSLDDRMFKLSPGAAFLYRKMNPGRITPLKLYDSDGDFLFEMPMTYSYQVRASSDDNIIVLEDLKLSYWEVSGERKLWETEIPREYLVGAEFYKILYSNENDIISVRDQNGCYCYDFNGNLLWSQRGLEGRDFLGTVGLSPDNGRVLISSVPEGNEYINVSVFSRQGQVLMETRIQVGSGEIFAGDWDHVADVYPEIMLLRFETVSARNHKDRMPATGIIFNDSGSWVTMAVEGFWYFLPAEGNTGKLIGIGRDKSRILSFPLDIGREK